MPIRLGELLLTENMVSARQLQEALDHQKLSGGSLAQALVSLRFVKDEEITSLLARRYGVPSIDLGTYKVDPAIIKIIPAEMAWHYHLLPLSRTNATVTIAIADPTNVFAMDDIKLLTGCNVQPVVASERALEDAIHRCYGPSSPFNLDNFAIPPWIMPAETARKYKLLSPREIDREAEIVASLSREYGVPSVNLDKFAIPSWIIQTIPAQTARKYKALPLSRMGATLTVAMADPANVPAMDDMKVITGYNIEPVVASERALDDGIDEYYGPSRPLPRLEERGMLRRLARRLAEALNALVKEKRRCSTCGYEIKPGESWSVHYPTHEHGMWVEQVRCDLCAPPMMPSRQRRIERAIRAEAATESSEDPHP